MREFLPRPKAQAAVGVARETGCPLAWPANDRDHAAPRLFQVEIGKASGGGPPARGREPVLRVRRQGQRVRFVAVRCAVVGRLMMQ